MFDSILFNTDSYKVSMWKQYPPGTKYVYSYIEARGGRYDRTVVLGLQAFIREYLEQPITAKDVERADRFWTAHGEPFNREGWDYIVEKHKGLLPLEIKGIAEGSVVNISTPLVTVVNTDPKMFWLTTWVETALLRAIWYSTTVATQSWYIKQLLLKYLEKSGDVANINFMLHDFGARGVSSQESAGLGGMAHLVNFMGTDTPSALLAAATYYDADPYSTAFSIPAAEHSTITSWGRDNEAEAYSNMVAQFSKPGSIYAVVSDSYDIYKATEMWSTGDLKAKVIASGGTLVIRPDSGDPAVVLPRLLKTLLKGYGAVKNAKGYLKLNNVKLIWGDGINEASITSILRVCVDVMGFSADNFAFGMGGALLQGVNRDTCEFAMKASAAYINDEWVNVYKDPVDSPSKRSKTGVFSVLRVAQENYETLSSANNEGLFDPEQDELKLRYKNGMPYNEITFNEVRVNSAS